MEAFLYYVLIVNRAFSGLCWGGPQGGLPEELENRDWNPKKYTTLVFRRRFGE
jgi:hypothetical protein